MPFCPTCQAEYKAGKKVCPDCDTVLVAKLDAPITENTRDVYRCHDDEEAAIVMKLLRDAGIEALLRDRTSSMFPMHVGPMTERVIAVPEHQRDKARAIVARAVADEVVGGDGEVV